MGWPKVMLYLLIILVWLCNVQKAGDPCKCWTLKEKVLSCFSKDGSFLTALIEVGCDFPVNSKFQFQFFLNHYFLQIFFLLCEFHLSHRALSLPSPLPLSHTYDFECNGCHFSLYLSICSHDQHSQSSPYFASSMRILFILGLFWFRAFPASPSPSLPCL